MHSFFLYFIGIALFFVSCKKENNEDLYHLLNECKEDFYLNLGVSVKEKMADFEEQLMKEGHLTSKNHLGYRALLRKLSKELYFAPPLKLDDFNSKLLYENPSDILLCVEDTYNIDSVRIQSLPFYAVNDSIRALFSEKEEVPVHRLFKIYASSVPEEEYAMPFVKESILLFLYRWYFTSKYNRDIPIEME